MLFHSEFSGKPQTKMQLYTNLLMGVHTDTEVILDVSAFMASSHTKESNCKLAERLNYMCVWNTYEVNVLCVYVLRES